MEVPLRTAYGQNGRCGMQPKAKHSLRAQAQLMRTETVETFELVKVEPKLLRERRENERGRSRSGRDGQHAVLLKDDVSKVSSIRHSQRTVLRSEPTQASLKYLFFSSSKASEQTIECLLTYYRIPITVETLINFFGHFSPSLMPSKAVIKRHPLPSRPIHNQDTFYNPDMGWRILRVPVSKDVQLPLRYEKTNVSFSDY
ncbi:hypothetical protein TNCV_764391 [Trichonephila clavipes]|nr:hypothetical protein TNCV_764391 [Trichonephila clavipes]